MFLTNRPDQHFPFFDKFRHLFIALLKKGTIKSFEDLYESILFEMGEGYVTTKHEIDTSSTWYKNIVELEFLNPIIEKSLSNEIILKSNGELSILTKEGWSLAQSEVEIDFQLALETLAFKNGETWNYSRPFASFKANILSNSFRMTLLHFSIDATNHSTLLLRRQSNFSFPLESFSSDPLAQNLLAELIRDKKNIIVSGSTGSGKTALAKTLLELTKSHERLVILEDVLELGTYNRPNITALLAEEGVLNKSLVDFCSYALRLSPDRLIIGEIRSKEIVPLLLSMNTGHKGILSTIHANSSIDTLHRLSTLFAIFSGTENLPIESLNNLISRNIEYVIFVENKKISEVAKVIGHESGHFFIESVYRTSA